MEKKVQRVIIAVLGGMGVILAGRSISLLQKDGYQWGMVLAGNAYSELGEEAAAGYLPLFQYEESDAQTSETFLQRVYEAAKDQIPFYGYWKQQSARAKVIEDENTCHALIEANEQAAERLLGKISSRRSMRRMRERRRRAREARRRLTQTRLPGVRNPERARLSRHRQFLIPRSICLRRHCQIITMYSITFRRGPQHLHR